MLLAVVLAGLAGWRLAEMLVNERGPGDVFRRLRAWAGVPDEGIQEPRPFVGALVSCTYCASVWTSAGCYALGELGSWHVVALVAAAGVAMALLDVGSRLHAARAM